MFRLSAKMSRTRRRTGKDQGSKRECLDLQWPKNFTERGEGEVRM